MLPMTYYHPGYIKQLFVREYSTDLDIATRYALYAVLQTGEERRLLYNLRKNVLLFLEQEIERLFGIEDQKVRGEVTE